MIHIAVATGRAFLFPAPFSSACAYYRNWDRLLLLLPQLQLVHTFAPGEYRLSYRRAEMPGYMVTLFCDAVVEFDEANATLHISPLEKYPPVPGRATRHGLTGQGSFSSTMALQERGDKTRITYHMQMEAVLETPVRLAWVPDVVVERIIKGRVEKRMQEMDDEFIARLIEDYSSSSIGNRRQ